LSIFFTLLDVIKFFERGLKSGECYERVIKIKRVKWVFFIFVIFFFVTSFNEINADTQTSSVVRVDVKAFDRWTNPTSHSKATANDQEVYFTSISYSRELCVDLVAQGSLFSPGESHCGFTGDTLTYDVSKYQMMGYTYDFYVKTVDWEWNKTPAVIVWSYD
jgi:hypothetical protein